jgi:microcystin-dependent protein
MATKAHKLLTGTDLHEPKGVATAPAGQVYVSDGAGSGAWTTINTTIAFSTGDAKLTYKQTADSGWIMLDDSTIGPVGSTAGHVDSSFLALFTLWWNWGNLSVTPSRGGSAAADWAALKAIAMPKTLGRALAVAGAGSGLTNRLINTIVGEENHTLIAGEIPNITMTSTGTNSITVTNNSNGVPYNVSAGSTAVSLTGGSTYIPTAVSTFSAGTGNFTSAGNNSITVSGTSNNTGSGGHNNMQPTTFINVMVKL